MGYFEISFSILLLEDNFPSNCDILFTGRVSTPCLFVYTYMENEEGCLGFGRLDDNTNPFCDVSSPDFQSDSFIFHTGKTSSKTTRL